MKSKKDNIELPFDIQTLRNDLQEVRAITKEAINSDEEVAEELGLLGEVIEVIDELLVGIKNPDSLQKRQKINLLAHFVLFRDLIDHLQESADFYEGEDYDDDDSEFDDEDDSEFEGDEEEEGEEEEEPELEEESKKGKSCKSMPKKGKCC